MKYFTREWWASEGGSTQDAFDAYDSYLASVRERLPPALVTLEAEHTLHDAEVKQIECSFDARAVGIALNGWNRELEYPVRYVLKFFGVSQFDQVLPQQDYVEEELGDLGYWECELLDKSVEVRMLFVSGAEFRIVFTDFSFEHLRRDT